MMSYRDIKLKRVVMASLLSLGMACPTALQASADTQSGTGQTREATATLSLRLYEKLQEIIELIQQEKLVEASQALDKLKERMSSYNGHERARIWSSYAYIHYQAGNFNATADAYRRALAEPGVPAALYDELTFSLAQVYFLQEKYRQSLALMENWLQRVAEPGYEAQVFIGQLYYQLEQFQRALPFVKQAVTAYQNQQKRVPENWYQLLNVLYFELKDYRQSLGVMLSLLAEYPKKRYYEQLSALYAELGQEFKQFSIQQALQDAGLMTRQTEWVVLCQFLLHQERPYRAAELLQEGIEKGIVKPEVTHLKMLANAWMQAREDERALQPLEQAAAKSEDGELYLMLAQAQLNLEHWEQAAAAARNALRKGELKRPDRAYLLRGMAMFNLKDFDNAITAFTHAGKDQRSRKFAEQWIRYVRAERQRRAELASAEKLAGV